MKGDLQMLTYCREYLTKLENQFVKYRSSRRLQQSKQGGFTLVELMVVVAVIAILAAIAMPQFMSAADKAKNAKQVADIQIIRNATQLYMIDKSIDTPPTVEKLYQEGYLTEHVKTTKGKEYVISYEQVTGNSGKSVVVTAPET